MASQDADRPVPGAADDGLMGDIRAWRAATDAFVTEKEPVGRRLSTVSIVSSSLAAALTAGPGLGGDAFADTVKGGLGLQTSQTVWQFLCLGAVAVSVTAAISTKLSTERDLAGQLTQARTARGLLGKVERQLKRGELSPGSAAREFEDIVAAIHFVPPLDGAQPDRRGRSGSALALMALPALVAAVLVVLALIGLAAGAVQPSPDPGAGGGSGAAPASSSAGDGGTPGASAPASSTPAPETAGVFTGRTTDATATLAIVTGAGEAVAYLCDGEDLEAWLRGSVTGGRMALTGPDGATLTATVSGGAVAGEVRTRVVTTPFVASREGAPAGVYEANLVVDGQDARIGWAVQADGRQVGVLDLAGSRSAAPRLDLRDLSFTMNGTRDFAHPFGP